ncbi:MAG: PKD domain-containing protein [Phycisphaerae bacterium]
MTSFSPPFFRRHLRIYFALACLVVGTGAAWSQTAVPLGSGWPYRRKLTVAAVTTRGPGKPMAWARFYTNSRRLPDGADLRVINSSGLVMPMKILRVSPDDDQVTVAFETPSPGTYFACWGNPHPGTPPPELKIERGVYLRSYRFRPGGNHSPVGMLSAFEHSQVIGRQMVPNIFLGYNPFGYSRRAMLLYSGWIHIVRPGRYTFAFDVAQRGFVKLGSDILLSKSGAGGMWGRVRFHRSVHLRRGWHRVVVGEICLWQPTGVSLDWITPGQFHYHPVPPQAFAAAPRATAGILIKRGSSYQADFNIMPEAQIFVPSDHYFQRYAFSVNVPASFAPALRWQFSDGQRAVGLRVDHEFLTPGDYTVKVIINQGNHEFTAVRRIAVKAEMYSRFPYPPTDPAINVARLISGYQLSRLSAEQLYRGVRFFEHYSAYRGLNHWAIAWALSTGREPARQVIKTAVRLARGMEIKRQYHQAANLYLLVTRKPISRMAKAKLMGHYAVTEGDFGQEAGKALAEIEHWRKHLGHMPPAAARIATIAECYAAVAAGNGPLAKKLARQTQGPYSDFKKAELRQGELARNVESYIDSSHFDTARDLLNRWDLEFPDAIIQGFTRMERMKLMAAMGHLTVAGRMGMAFVKACPDSFYAAEILHRSSKYFKSAGHRTLAMLAQAMLKKNYPESPYAQGH